MVAVDYKHQINSNWKVINRMIHGKAMAAEAGGSETKNTEVREVRNYPGKGGRTFFPLGRMEMQIMEQQAYGGGDEGK